MVVMLISASAAAQLCMDSDKAEAKLKRDFQEEQAGWGVDQRGHVIYRLFVNPYTGSWTIVRTWPNGQTCMVLGGRDWTWAPPPGTDT